MMTSLVIFFVLLICIISFKLKTSYFLQEKVEHNFNEDVLSNPRWINLLKNVALLYEKKQKTSRGNQQPHVIKLIIKPRQQQFFKGMSLKKTFQQLNLSYGPDKFFHKRVEGKAMYTICHLYEPGIFSFYSPEETFYSGLVIIFLAHELDDPKMAFDLLFLDAHQINQDLQGHLLDEFGNSLGSSNYQFIKQQFDLWFAQQEDYQKAYL